MLRSALRAPATAPRFLATGSGEPLGHPAVLRSNRTSLHLPARMPLEEWLHVGERLHAMADSASWWLGDWLVYGQDRYPERYRHAVDSTSLDYKTLRNYAWIARRVPRERRRTGLSMQHHAEVAPLPPHLQVAWLERAAKAGWSRNELRRRVRAEADPRADKVGPDTPARATLALEISAVRYGRYTATARRTGQDVTQWMLAVLDAAVANSTALDDR